ncbi:FAD:protein FMN transferase [Latilactobacillus fuchuensis]|jgi:thiamine biosynthesis lipoprotein|uniref:FAD:protein FMN transferase n=2 Tax=Latilactobacillus fuchuensis TaxID=164393 RepID=A0A2N9DXN0_9LACO|nr:FAD:protein FMN transferase [Latilactobacillus fuchuensis]KRL58540.1 thiamin biosynthesis ApbE [Latilactobacillus fuchuensis DSM 14340 = JCM 11249]MCP8857221.1 FAD:protein FMN transferase [Latilactobacillus fuchuensis]SPC39435.1 ApbE family protein [Latilactobacillus fuchuensis]
MLETSQVYLMGTVIDIQIEADQPAPIIALVERRLAEYEHRFSANDDTSELMAVNLAAGQQAVTVAPELYQLIKLGKQHSLAANGNLNITIGPLVQTWRIGFDDARVPSAAEITAVMQLVDPRQIELNDDTHQVRLAKAGMAIDLGALAKGYIADLIMVELKTLPVQSALINLGGNIVAYGPNQRQSDGNWRIGIQDPREPRDVYLDVVLVQNQSVVTSGIYERHLERNGQTYHHIFDRQTGYPIQTDLLSLTIISDLSVTGEIWTTRLFGLPDAEILVQVNATPGIEGILVTANGTIMKSNGLV